MNIITQELLKQIVILQDLAAKRGLELINAAGAKWNYYKTPERIAFNDESVEMTFEENTRHDCPDRESITLTIRELMLNDEEWAAMIEQVKSDTKLKKEQAEQKERESILESKRKQLKALKAELGE
jgi:hypothetical protein